MGPHDPFARRLERLSIRHDVSVHRTPVSYFAERVRRLQFFSFARLGPAFWTARARGGTPADPARAAVLDDVARRLHRLSPLDTDLFVATEGRAGTEPSRDDEIRFAAMERTLPAGYVAEDGALLHRATLDGTIRALYDALRPHHVVAVGSPVLIELAGTLRLGRFSLKAVRQAEAIESRHAFRERLAVEHLAFCREPVVYLFDAGTVAPWWILELHGRLHNAFLLDFGSVLDACIPERVMDTGWSALHWRAVARHLGLDSGQRPARPVARAWHPPSPWDAPGRPRPERRTPAVDRRRSGAWHRPELEAESSRSSGSPDSAGSTRPDGPLERIHEGDLERCLADVLARRTRP